MRAVKEISLACLVSTKKMLIDDLQMSIKCPTSEEQICEQEAAAHFDRSSFFYLSALMVGTQCIVLILACVSHTTALNASSDSYSLEVKLYP